jgi:hypothetical protein
LYDLVANVARYPHGHVQSPLQLADHVGDTSPAVLFREVLVLTKMNWNSAKMSGLKPITCIVSRRPDDSIAHRSTGEGVFAAIAFVGCDQRPLFFLGRDAAIAFRLALGFDRRERFASRNGRFRFVSMTLPQSASDS